MIHEQLERFSLFQLGNGRNFGSLFSGDALSLITARLTEIESNPLTLVQLNQLLVLAHQAPMGQAFFKYYWLSTPRTHSYAVRDLAGFSDTFLGGPAIKSLDHLYWGLYRFYVDGLLYFGNIRTAYQDLRTKSLAALKQLFLDKRFPTQVIKDRGPALPLRDIPKDDRYLIAEMACKSLGDGGVEKADLVHALRRAFTNRGKKVAKIKELLHADNLDQSMKERQVELEFAANDILEEQITDLADIERKCEVIVERYQRAREAALANTRYYLSMVSDIDVYVATSMRNRQDFRDMADRCDKIFRDSSLSDLNIRYFDPTMSAAEGHEDKGLIECLMVKCAKVLVYIAGTKESFGKDAEAAMALSQGKPVVFLCDQEARARFYKDVHPLSRLIDFKTGVAVGAMATDNDQDVMELLTRIFNNRMEYTLEQPKPGYLRLRESVTKSVVRLQTNNELLAATFWNHYHLQ